MAPLGLHSSLPARVGAPKSHISIDCSITHTGFPSTCIVYTVTVHTSYSIRSRAEEPWSRRGTKLLLDPMVPRLPVCLYGRYPAAPHPKGVLGA